MASDATALSPQQAVEALASIRQYRERLTGQASATLWIVWALVVVYAGLVAMVTTSQQLEGEKAVATVLWILGIGAGAMVTNAVLRMQAIEKEPGMAAWMPYAMGASALAVVIVVDAALGHLLQPLFGASHRPLGFASFNLLPAAVAFVLSFLQRRRVSPLAGYATAAAFVVLYAVAAFGPWTGDHGMDDFFWSFLWLVLAFTAYLALGLRAWVRG